MILFYQIQVIIGCVLQSQQQKELSLYPTVGEYLECSLSKFFMGENLIYNYEPVIPNVQVVNAITKQTQIEGHDFKSLSSNQTHFATITQENNVILYKWQNFSIHQNEQIFTIKESYHCNNIILFTDIDILLDCYAEQNFYLFKLINNNLIVVYTIEAKEPIKTKMYQIFDQSKTFLIYAQYYYNQSILTLFSSQFQNLTSLQSQFIQISIPLRENPNIYILFQQSISQLSITQNYTFELTAQYHSELIYKLFQVYYNYQTSSQCDQLDVLVQGEEQNYVSFQFQGCQNLIVLENVISYNSKKLNSLNFVFLNKDFVLLQSQRYITIYQQVDGENSIGEISINKNTQIYLNTENNYLFSFDKKIIIYQLNYPQLQINLTTQNISGNSYQIVVYGQLTNITFKDSCKMYISLSILNQSDTNIYVMFNQNFPQYEPFSSPNINEFVFVGYSGQLLSFIPNTDNAQFGKFKKNTFQKVFQFINQNFVLAQLLYPIYFLNNSYDLYTYFIGINDVSIQILNYSQETSLNLVKTIKASINAQQLQVAYSMYSTIIIGVSENDTIYLYQLKLNGSLETSNYQFKQQFSEFLVTYSHLITLLSKKLIYIMNLNLTNLVIINEKMIHQLVKTEGLLQFNPIQIAVNTQSLSSCLFINNIHNIIILAISYNNTPIPISIIELNFIIYQMNIVGQHLVLSYVCKQGLDFCFQVWNIQNVRQPYFVRNMMSINYNKKVKIQSDNLFFYVTLSNYTVYVYNPSLPQQMNLYYLLEFTSPLICSVQQSTNSLIYNNDSIYRLSIYQGVQFYVNQSLDFDRFYPSIIYNYTVTSLLNQTAIQYTPNQSLTYQSNFTIFQPQINNTIILNTYDLNLKDQTFTIQMNLILNRQADVCYFPNNSFYNSYYSNNRCNLTNFNYKIQITENIKNYTLITTINNQLLILQNNNQIQVLNQYLEFLSQYDYSNLNFIECLKSTSSSLTLSSICQNKSAQYWISISFDNEGNVIEFNLSAIPSRFINISKINNILNLNFILGSQVQFKQNLYLFNIQNNSIELLYDIDYIGDFNCQDFSVALFNFAKDFNKQNKIIILYIIDSQPYSQYLYINEDSIIIQPIQEILWIYDSVFFLQVLILEIIKNKLFVLLTNIEGFGQLYVFRLSMTNLNLQIQDVLTSIPLYGNFQLISNSIYQNGLLLQQFQQGNSYLIGVYQMSDFLDQSYNIPILMLGSQQTTSLEYALIVNQNFENATCLFILNGSIWNYPINTKTLTCHYMKRKKIVQVNVICQNEFSLGNYQLTFILPALEKSRKGWIYQLLIIIVCLLIFFYILVKNRLKKFPNINAYIQIEF
ncbi:unnamed protein product [Paramecium sonneborni]|uniref:Transmembrane protein n=1 Tax=Paramecium sonneborni TaxID=65129 RepID=A0A8S1QEW3_9CILI|nr:unnamed protein product [Paramecium sonneborni]